MNAIHTRKQWMQKLEAEIQSLTLQRDALKKRLLQIQSQDKVYAILRIQSELGEVEKRYTKAKEQYEKAIMTAY